VLFRSSSPLILSMKDSSQTLGILLHLKASTVLRNERKASREKERQRRTSQYDSSISYFLLNLGRAGPAFIAESHCLGLQLRGSAVL
jgi:hypothetical protein